LSEEEGIFEWELINKLSNIKEEKILLLSHHASTEKSCLISLNKYWSSAKIFEEEQFKNINLQIEKDKSKKCFLSSLKPKDLNMNFFKKSIIFVDTIQLIKFHLKEKNSSYSLQNLYKKYVNINYQEKHRSLNDCLDLFELLKKLFEKKNFFKILTKFLEEGKNGKYFFQ